MSAKMLIAGRLCKVVLPKYRLWTVGALDSAVKEVREGSSYREASNKWGNLLAHCVLMCR
jgi:hypothetical protein